MVSHVTSDKLLDELKANCCGIAHTTLKQGEIGQAKLLRDQETKNDLVLD